MRYFLVFVAVFLVLAVCSFGGIKLDLQLNPWVRQVTQIRWYNFLTSHHGITFLYLHKGHLWLIAPFLLSMLTMLSYVIANKKS